MDENIIDYTLLQGSSEELIRLVKAKISQGWVPIGGIAVAANRPTIGRLDCTYIQAMVRHNNDERSAIPPSLPISEPSVPCPHCNANIGVSGIKTGKNTCPTCKGDFTAS